VGCGTGLDWGDWFVILGPDTAVPFPYGYITKTCDRPKADANKSFNLRY